MSSTANTRTSGGPARGLITCVLTSCNRYDLLQITLENLFGVGLPPAVIANDAEMLGFVVTPDGETLVTRGILPRDGHKYRDDPMMRLDEFRIELAWPCGLQ